MSERREGWYHIRMPSAAWEPLYWDGEKWTGHEYTELYDNDMADIGPRIPSPDEDWVCVPKEPTLRMAMMYGSKSQDRGFAASLSLGGYKDMLAAAPSPDDTP